MFYLKILRKLNLYDDSTKIILTSKNDFKNLTNIYLNKLFGTVTNASHEFFLLNNSFDFNPEPCLNLIENGYSIIVERDPRDIFASTLNSQDGFIPIVERTLENNILKKRKFLGTSEISQFIKRYKILRLNENKSNNSRILRLRFEDFVINHLETADQLNNFLKLDLRNKKVSELLFNPEESKQNVGIWKKYRHLPEIAIIEKELGEYCYQN
jgi:hypothetical protein